MNFQPLRPENQTYHTTNQNLDNRLQQTPYYKPLPLTRRSRFVQLTPAQSSKLFDNQGAHHDASVDTTNCDGGKNNPVWIVTSLDSVMERRVHQPAT